MKHIFFILLCTLTAGTLAADEQGWRLVLDYGGRLQALENRLALDDFYDDFTMQTITSPWKRSYFLLKMSFYHRIHDIGPGSLRFEWTHENSTIPLDNGYGYVDWNRSRSGPLSYGRDGIKTPQDSGSEYRLSYEFKGLFGEYMLSPFIAHFTQSKETHTEHSSVHYDGNLWWAGGLGSWRTKLHGERAGLELRRLLDGDWTFASALVYSSTHSARTNMNRGHYVFGFPDFIVYRSNEYFTANYQYSSVALRIGAEYHYEPERFFFGGVRGAFVRDRFGYVRTERYVTDSPLGGTYLSLLEMVSDKLIYESPGTGYEYAIYFGMEAHTVGP